MNETICLAFIFSSMLVIPIMWHVVVPAVWILEFVWSTERVVEYAYALRVEYHR